MICGYCAEHMIYVGSEDNKDYYVCPACGNEFTDRRELAEEE